MSRVIKLNEIIPGVLFQRGQFVTFPVKTKIEMLERYNINMVVNLWARPDMELHQKQGLVYIHWPIGGGDIPPLSAHMEHLILSHMHAKPAVLIHCEAGVNRSIWLITKLLSLYYNISGPEAWEQIQGKVGRTKVRNGLFVDLETFVGHY